jgi:hypothetical protein
MNATVCAVVVRVVWIVIVMERVCLQSAKTPALPAVA